MKYYKLIDIRGLGGGGYATGVIYPETYKRSISAFTVGTMINSGERNFELSTKAAYNKQEGIVPKPRVKKVVEVDPHVFKVGDKVKFTDCKGTADSTGLWYSWARNQCTINEEYTVYLVESTGNIEVVEDALHLTLSRNQFELSTQTKLKQTEMENYSIEGSKALKTAFVEECELKLSSATTLDSTRILISEGVPVGTVQSRGIGKEPQHFVLPKDWEKAVAYVREFNTPKVVFKVGDWVTCITSKTLEHLGAGHQTGLTFKITDVRAENCAFPAKGGNGVYFYALRFATPAEIKAVDIPVFKMAGYDSTINKLAKTISFGCQTYTKKEVKLLLDAAELCERVGYSAKVKGSGFVVNETDILTPASLTKILKLLK